MAISDESVFPKRPDFGEDCESCRWVSGLGIIGIGVFVFSSANKQKSKLGRNFIYMLSLGICSIGTARLLALSPFARTKSD